MSARPAEVIQASAMDSGVSALRAFLEGLGVAVDPERLADALGGDIDGTSIDTIEAAMLAHGLDAEQVLLPIDHVPLADARALPAIVVVRRPDGLTHFVLAWARRGGSIDVMDPATGWRTTSVAGFLAELHVHEQQVPAATWRSWAGGPELLGPLERRLAALGVAAARRRELVAAAVADPGIDGLAALDAACRFVATMELPDALSATTLERVLERARREPGALPEAFYAVRAAAVPGDVIARGAVLVRAPRPRRTTSPSAPPTPPLTSRLRQLLRAEGTLRPAAVMGALAIAGGGLVVEALILQSLVDVGRDLEVAGTRLGAFGAALAFLLAMLVLEVPMTAALLGAGRRVELRLRLAFLEKLPRLGERYFRGRLMSDLAQRCHAVHGLRFFPTLSGDLVKLSFQLVLTIAGIIWIDPRLTPIALLAAACAVVIPWRGYRVLAERDLRFRCHAGTLSRYYLDALRGVLAIRAHGAARTFRREHATHLAAWSRAGLDFYAAAIAVETLGALVGFVFTGWLVVAHASGEVGGGTVLLLVYWTLSLPTIGQALVHNISAIPAHRSALLRLAEPLEAPDEEPTTADARAGTAEAPETMVGVALTFQRVSVAIGGLVVLREIDLEIEAGEHVAIVGPSGAGKSTLVGVLQGWNPTASGRVLVDGEPIDVAGLRPVTAWVAPEVQLWNRTLLDNLSYGEDPTPEEVGNLLDRIELRRLLEVLPSGLQTALGEGGAMLSGGDGQRVRLGRALLRRARLVLLDEPFRALDAPARTRMLARCRTAWPGATLLCVTHDVGETLGFDRVVVVEDGRVVEVGPPKELAARPGSRYAASLAAERALQRDGWAVGWLRRDLAEGRIEGGE